MMSASPLVPALIALFVGSAGVPLTFKGLMTRVPKFNAIWAILHPVHGLLLYTFLLAAIRPAQQRRAFNPLYAVPISALFGVYNVMKGSCGKGDGVPGIVVHLTDQLEPLVVMAISIAVGQRRSFPGRQWAAAMVLLAASSWYIARDTATALDVKSPYQLCMCVSKNAPLATAFMYIEWILATRFANLFPTVLWWWVCVFQTFTTLIPAYMQFVPEEFDGRSYASFIRSGVSCYWFGEPQGECGGMPLYNAAGVVFGGAMNLAMPVVARHGGAPVLMMVRALTLPVVAFLFTCPSLVGDSAEVLDSQKMLSLFFATIALFLWATGATRSHKHID